MYVNSLGQLKEESHMHLRHDIMHEVYSASHNIFHFCLSYLQSIHTKVKQGSQ